MAKDVAGCVEQIDLGGRVDDHRVSGKVPQAVEVGNAVRDELTLIGYVHRDRRVQMLRQLVVVSARVDAVNKEERGAHAADDDEQGDREFCEQVFMQLCSENL